MENKLATQLYSIQAKFQLNTYSKKELFADKFRNVFALVFGLSALTFFVSVLMSGFNDIRFLYPTCLSFILGFSSFLLVYLTDKLYQEKIENLQAWLKEDKSFDFYKFSLIILLNEKINHIEKAMLTLNHLKNKTVNTQVMDKLVYILANGEKDNNTLIDFIKKQDLFMCQSTEELEKLVEEKVQKYLNEDEQVMALKNALLKSEKKLSLNL